MPLRNLRPNNLSAALENTGSFSLKGLPIAAAAKPAGSPIGRALSRTSPAAPLSCRAGGGEDRGERSCFLWLPFISIPSFPAKLSFKGERHDTGNKTRCLRSPCAYIVPNLPGPSPRAAGSLCSPAGSWGEAASAQLGEPAGFPEPGRSLQEPPELHE